MMKLAPNFEMAMYLAQATGSCIVTDCLLRWRELKNIMYRGANRANTNLTALTQSIEEASFAFPQRVEDVNSLASAPTFAGYSTLMRGVFRYLSRLANTAPNCMTTG